MFFNCKIKESQIVYFNIGLPGHLLIRDGVHVALVPISPRMRPRTSRLDAGHLVNDILVDGQSHRVRLAYEFLRCIGGRPPIPGAGVIYKDGNPYNLDPRNLTWSTAKPYRHGPVARRVAKAKAKAKAKADASKP